MCPITGSLTLLLSQVLNKFIPTCTTVAFFLLSLCNLTFNGSVLGCCRKTWRVSSCCIDSHGWFSRVCSGLVNRTDFYSDDPVFVSRLRS